MMRAIMFFGAVLMLISGLWSVSEFHARGDSRRSSAVRAEYQRLHHRS